MLRIMSQGWYTCHQAEDYTGIHYRAVRRRLEDKPRDNIFLKMCGQQLLIRGCILHGLKQGVDYERVVSTQKKLLNEGVVHVALALTANQGDVGYFALKAVKENLNGRRCHAYLDNGDMIEVTLAL